MSDIVAICQKACRVILLMVIVLYGKKVCKISYNDYPSNLDGITIEAPNDAVALSESIKIEQPDDSSVTVMNTPAIMFVIDNSGSMFIPHQYNKNLKDSTYELARDPEGNRFSVTKSLIDSLYEKDPASEVGLTVFGSELHYDTTGELGVVVKSGSFFSVPGSFKIFLQLNKEYEELGKKMTGYEFISHYLETEIVEDTIAINTSLAGQTIKLRDTVVEFTMLKNLRTDFRSYTGTNIDLAFDAVLKSLTGTTAQKKNQYTIFFSDGVPSGSSGNDFADGKGVPTTYTIFFSPDMVAPNILKTMNTNIQNNGYSSSNPKSELWPFDNSSHDDLLEFMVENILNKINADITTKPVEITINGKTNGKWENDHFVFSDEFELIGDLSPFKFDISYLLETKSSDGSVEVETINEEVDFSVERLENPTFLDSLVVEYWDREILFYADGSEINALDEKSEEFELRFKESRIDCNYRYEDVEIVLTSTKMGDELTVSLDEKDEHNFRKTVVVDFKASSADKGDYVLQIAPDDEIVAFFKNPNLRLDTLTATLGTDISNSLIVESATYLDKDADGFVDEITMDYRSLLPISDEIADDLKKVIKLPSFRSFEITDIDVKSDELLLSVDEDRDEFQTYCSSKDVIKIEEKDLDSILIESQSIEVIDKIAPVIKDEVVSVVRGVDKTILTVTFSEEVQDFDSDEPLLLYDGTSKYGCKLAIENSDDNTYRFEVTDGFEDMKSGDSLHIAFSANIIGDTLGNWQRNKKNIKREISVSEEIAVTSAAYYDGTCDGHPDTIRVKLESVSDLDDVSVEKLVSIFELPSYRELEIKDDDVELDGKTLILPVKENREEINTGTTDEDVLTVKEKEFDGYFVKGNEFAIDDEMAPVIKSNPVLYINTLDDDKDDTLRVTFSESVEDPDEEHLLKFYREESSFEGELDLISHNDDNAVFGINGFTKDKRELLKGDSVNVNFGLWDFEDNEQKKSFNIKRAIDVKLLLPKIKVKLIAVNPYIIKETTIPDEVVEFIEDVDKYELDESDSGYVGCLIMTQFEPESLLGQIDMEIDGTITILDKVGNTIVEKVTMEFVKELGQLVYIWNGKNSLNRTVGGDSFVITSAIQLQIANGRKMQFQDEIVISTKKDD